MQECANNCLLTTGCNWFKLDGKTCTYYQHLPLTKGAGGRGTQYGFLRGGDNTFLNLNVDDAKSLFKLGGNTFYTTKDKKGKAVSVYVDGDNAACTTTPLALYRSFALNYASADMIKKVKSGEIINSMDDQFTLESFLKAIKPKSDFAFDIQNDAINVKSNGDVVRTGKQGTLFQYRLDEHGRTVSAKAHVNYDNVLRKPGAPSKNGAGKTIRAQYCYPAYQSRYNVVQLLQDAKKVDLEFQAGHLFGCQFTNPNGFFNFVPQNVMSNARNGCWYNTELMTSHLLKMGCEGDLHVRLTYLNTPGDLSEVKSHTGALLSEQDADEIYKIGGNDNAGAVERPCGYFYRPIKMSIDFTITGAMADSRCSMAMDAVSAANGKFYAVDGSKGAMTVSRAFAYWSYETPAFNRLRGMATTDYRANQCYAETGTLVGTMLFDNAFDRTLLKVKSTAKPAMCLTVTSTGQLQVGACDAASKTNRWSSSNQSLVNNAAACVKAAGDSSCIKAAFQYAKASVSFNGDKTDLRTPEDLVDGTVVVGNKCLVVDGKSVALKTSGCTVFQSVYQLDGVGGDDDDDDN
ncbi:TPA: hypothetical protein N0F65_004257 [Lagenidium giganteum]|uniref:Apple domain-containing protein n=1 Tax=Lagenidium giganteum TaxID=4803 RepID=A0AAV2ZDV4_9STRA|nr:TPA: hypothetical protein N0F65_004257 [Lagenidium giganteum]